MAPTHLRPRFLKLIERERRRAEAGQPAEIVAKMNSLIDEEIIGALYAASQAGVVIKLNVRGICALRPGVPGVSETIEVISVVDRFLEHSRDLLLPERRRRAGVPVERGLDEPQSRQAGRADVPDRGSRAQERRCSTRSARCSGTTSRRAACAPTAPTSERARRPANSRSGSSSICRTRRAAARRWPASAPA